MRKLIALTALAMAASPAQADPVTAWMEAAQKFQRAANPPQGTLITDRFTPANVAVQTRVAAAMFEAANAADRRFEPYFGLAPATRRADVDAAIISAAHAVLVASYPQRKAELDASLAVSLASRPTGAALDEGLRLGREAAAMAMARQVFDPATPPINYVPDVAEGSYAGPNEGVGIPFIFGYKPWLLPSIEVIKVPPMPGLDSAAFRASVEETRTIGARNSTIRTSAQSASARFWVDGLNHLPTVRNLAAKPGARLVDIARLNALVTLADVDSYHVVDINKMRMMRWRPVTAIRFAGKKANDHGVTGTSWEPYLRTPATSEYPCAIARAEA